MALSGKTQFVIPHFKGSKILLAFGVKLFDFSIGSNSEKLSPCHNYRVSEAIPREVLDPTRPRATLHESVLDGRGPKRFVLKYFL